MPRLLVLQHGADTPLGRLGVACAQMGVEPVAVRLDLGEPIPSLNGFDGVAVMGGEMGAYDQAHHEWLTGEKDFLRRAVEAGTPVLGICLGAQLLADALGGRAFKAEDPEVGVVDVALTSAGRDHPVLRKLGSRVFTVHQDTFTLPPGATLLAESDRFPQAFECGSALAVQFHPEADAEIAIGWGRSGGAFLADGLLTREDFEHQLIDSDQQLQHDALAMFSAWLSAL